MNGWRDWLEDFKMTHPGSMHPMNRPVLPIAGLIVQKMEYIAGPYFVFSEPWKDEVRRSL